MKLWLNGRLHETQDREDGQIIYGLRGLTTRQGFRISARSFVPSVGRQRQSRVANARHIGADERFFTPLNTRVKTLKIEIDDEAFDRMYGHISHPIEVKKKGQKIAVRIISQFGEESLKILSV